LSPAVQRELLSELLRTTVLQFPLFKAANNAFIGEIAQAHTWVNCLPGDIVVEEGQVMSELVFVIRGKLIMHGNGGGNGGSPAGVVREEGYEILSDDDVVVHAGAWFGEACLFQEDRIRDFTVVAVVESELAVLTAHDYHRIANMYPRVLARHQLIAQHLQTGKLNLKMLAYSLPETAETKAGRLKARRRGLSGLVKDPNKVDNLQIIPHPQDQEPDGMILQVPKPR